MEEMEENKNPIPAPQIPTEGIQAKPATKVPFGSWWKVGVLVVGVVLAGSITYASYQYSQKQPSSVTYPTGAPTLFPTPTPDARREPTGSAETANWKTYTNTFHNYTIKYPQDWYLAKPSCEDECAPTISDTDLKERPQEPGDTTHIRLGILVFSQNSPSLQQWRNVDVTEEKPTTIAGISGIKRTETRNDFLQMGENIIVENIYINHGGKTYSLYFFPPTSNKRSTVDQILSTFKFLD